MTPGLRGPWMGRLHPDALKLWRMMLMEPYKERSMDEKAWGVIKMIVAKGNDAVVRKKGTGYIVLEDKRTIRYQTSG